VNSFDETPAEAAILDELIALTGDGRTTGEIHSLRTAESNRRKAFQLANDALGEARERAQKAEEHRDKLIRLYGELSGESATDAIKRRGKGLKRQR
jgi:hypothetical protein